MKIIRQRLIPFGRYGAINLCGLLFVKPGMALTPEIINHERIHSAQQRELLYLPFFILYLLEWLLRLLTNGLRPHAAYRALSFEREAYLHQSNPRYLKTRPPFAQWR